MPKCGIKKSLHILIHNSNLYYTLKQLKTIVVKLQPCCESIGTKIDKIKFHFNHPVKEFLWFDLLQPKARTMALHKANGDSIEDAGNPEMGGMSKRELLAAVTVLKKLN